MAGKRKWSVLLAAVLVGVALTACGGKKAKPLDVGSSAEPDKVLYERAMEDVRKHRYAVARLTLQTLINTYPDSEYLAKAKLAIADSFYQEGGTAGLAQAVAEYKDFITFFPFLEEAPYAQLQVGIAHFRRMEKPDRDRTEARLAEEELQTFLLKYPDHPLAAQAEQRLREVQEVLAEGDFRVGRYYYIKGSYRAATTRLAQVTSRYPLYSQADKALWMLANIFERSERSDLAAGFYGRIVREYPLSNLVDDAKEKLTKLGAAIPKPNPEALARMQREQEFAKEKPGMLRRSLGLFRTGPDVSTAAHAGKPNLTPATEATALAEVLTPGGTSSVGAGGSSSAVVVETVKPGSSGNATTTESKDPLADSGANRPKEEQTTGEAKPATEASKATENEKKKEPEKKEKASSSKKKKGLRRIIPW